ncbi:MAG: DUF4386 domain-containing protein [Bacteroidetes bacterium]|nr:DUF4386 domain-containing protein [Bacteroidota bacterium]
MTASKKLLKIAGISYLIIFFTAIFANFVAIENIVVSGDAKATFANLINNELVFRLAILSFIITIIFDVVIAWALWVLLKPVNKNFSLFAAWFRLVHAIVFAVGLFHLVSIIRISFGDANFYNLSGEQMASQVLLFFTQFNDTWLIGLIFFGVHLIALGYLLLRSKLAPKFIGILLYIAGIGYMIDSAAGLLYPNYADMEMVSMIIIIIPGVVGELSFTVWLLIKSFNSKPLQYQ